MPTTFSPCESSVSDMAFTVMKKYYPDLIEADVTIAYLFAENQDGQALKLHGYPAAATVKINSYANRVEGMTDATIKIDKSWWEERSEEDQLALLDHELCHLLLGTDDNGSPLTDDLGRPKLKMRQCDFQIEGFDQIVKRHGFAAEECRAVLETRSRWMQAGFEFFGDAGDDRGAP